MLSSNTRQLIQTAVIEQSLLRRQLDEGVKDRDRLAQEAELLSVVLTLLQACLDASRKSIKEAFESVVGSALSSIFGDEWAFKIKFKAQRGGYVAEPIILQDGREMRLLKDTGGSVRSVVGNALRIVFLLLCRPKLAKILILDESIEGIDRAHLELFSEFLRQIAEKAGVQIICISHREALEEYASNIVTVKRERQALLVEQEQKQL